MEDTFKSETTVIDDARTGTIGQKSTIVTKLETWTKEIGATVKREERDILFGGIIDGREFEAVRTDTMVSTMAAEAAGDRR